MKFLYITFLILATLSSCRQAAKHPQANLLNKNAPAIVTEQEILKFSDSIDANLNALEKQNSLIFNKGQESLYIEKYSMNGVPVVYKSYTEHDGLNSSVSVYYFNNDSLILVKESNKSIKQNGDLFVDKRTYLRNSIAFKREVRSASSHSSLGNKAYQTLNQTTPDQDDFPAVISTFNDALNGTDKFDLVFDNLISSAEEQYILLKSKLPNGYAAGIVVKDTDSFIDSLMNDPLLFKSKKLDLKWEIEDKEAVYVPVAAKATSASGLNK